MKYTKPHLSYADQLRLLAERGLSYDDEHFAIAALKSVGYYRLSAYTYVLRAPGEPVEGGERPQRSDRFVEGARLEDAVALCRFDNGLRLCLLDALQQIEIGMRVQIGYQLGKRDPFGHLTRASLDRHACAQPPAAGRAGQGSTQDAHEYWLSEFQTLCNKGRKEDFVQHFTTKYDGKMPIWVATELMTFGCLTSLYQLLGNQDARRIARNLEVKDQKVLHKWLKALNVLRNHCAHNNRIWNRKTTYPPAKPPTRLTPERLHHLWKADQHRLYFLAALSAHLVTVLDPSSDWPRRFKAVISGFPGVHGMTPENTMGFVSGWQELPLWETSTAAAR